MTTLGLSGVETMIVMGEIGLISSAEESWPITKKISSSIRPAL